MTKLKPAPAPSGGLGLLSYEEAARYLGPSITPRWVQDRVAEGAIRAVRPTQRCTRIEKRELERYVETAARPAARARLDGPQDP